MFSMSLKSVPGCLVSIAPRLIGVPVAATPGLVPHDEVETVPAAAELDDAAGAEEEAAALLAAELAGADEELLDEELELQPATTPIATAARTAAADRVRQWTDLFMCSAFSWLTENYFLGERARSFAQQETPFVQGSEPKKPPLLCHS
jgi:hypothetical protein